MHRKILIVDDNEINRQLLINTLGSDYDILEAGNGAEALQIMQKHYKMLSAVLLDIVMPEMDGYEVLRRARESTSLSQLPIIMVTGSEDEESRVKALSLGANDFILKPFNPEIVKHCLKNNIALRETASILNAIQRDKLTGLYNREAFFERADTLIRSHRPGYYCLSSFDIDNFKLINDRFGAPEGDRVLKELGAAVKEYVSNLDGLAGRISADNFAVLFPASDQKKGILSLYAESEIISFAQWPIVFSVGRYIVNDTLLAASAIYDRAYLAKQSVKGRYDKHLAYFDETMLHKLVRDQQITAEMETAIENHQFEVWFQPQYNHVTGAIVGAEALVRWRHPEKGLISPGEFIPLFEQNGFIYELDKFVWRETCRLVRRWLDNDMSPVPVSVNVSRYDIFRVDFIETVSGLISEFDIPIELLRLEITESAFAKSTKATVEIIRKLIEFGFIIEIDDFGSGYSSLNTLKSVPAQVVKLDMRFLEGGDDTKRGGNILESVVRMTQWLGMSVIAEGVETKEQGDFLKSIGCSCVQGYLYARPMPAEDYESLFSNSDTEAGLTVLETAEHLDNDSFWNPESLDSLIFNSYVGAACVYEYSDNRVELLRATDKFAAMFSGGRMTVEQLIRLDLIKYLDKRSAEENRVKIAAVVADKGETTGEFLFLGIPGCEDEIYIRSTMRVIAGTGDRYLIYCISENITAQRRSEQMEKRTADRLQTLLGNLPCGVTATVVSDGKLEFLFVNDKYYDLLGYTEQQYSEEIGTNTLLTVCREDAEYVSRIVEKTIRTGVPSTLEYRGVRRDSSLIWLRSYFSVTRFEGVDIPVRLCTFADITSERHTAQDLLDNLPCGAGICAVDGDDAHMTYVNKKYYTYFSAESGSRRTESAYSVIHPDDLEKLRKAIKPALTKGGVGSCVVRIVDTPGKYVTFRLSGVAVSTDNNQHLIYVTFVPISEEELSFSEMLPVALEKMMESSSDLSFIKDKELRYICCSRAFAHMVGLENEKAIAGKTDRELFSPELADIYTADDRRLMASGKSIVDAVEILPSDDGKTRYSSTSKYLLHDSSGEIIGLYGVGHDITVNKEAEERQKFLINNIPGGIAVYEGKCDDLKSIRLTWFSDGFCSLFGYSRDEYDKLSTVNPMGLISAEFVSGFFAQVRRLIGDGTPVDYMYVANTKNGNRRWIHVKAVLGETHGTYLTANAVFFDVTERQKALEQLRVSEEENRLALRHSKNVVCRYDIAKKTLRVSQRVNPIFGMSELLENVPDSQVGEGKISPETAAAYKEFYNNIADGVKDGSVTYQRISKSGWRWVEGHFSTIFSADGKPVSAVISFVDITDDFEKDIAYKKWLQSIHNRDPEEYSLFRCNIGNRSVFDTREGNLIKITFKPGAFRFDEHTAEYVENYVWDEDRERYRAFLSIEELFRRHRGGEHILMIEYREKTAENSFRWLRLTVDLVEYLTPEDVEAYLLFENIDENKRAELEALERAENDPLTGILNRAAFTAKVNTLIAEPRKDTVYAFIMIDLDGFKLVNDAFGHSVGDSALSEIAQQLCKAAGKNNLVGRLGGDEFVVFLSGLTDRNPVIRTAERICELCRKNFSAEVRVSASIGIALCPQDGTDFVTLYRKADEALYFVKGSGRNSYSFWNEDMKNEHLILEAGSDTEKKRRMLIVDDSPIDSELMSNIFRKEYIIERAKDGASALVRLSHCGSAISVVLLDLMMPEMDGFTVLEKIRSNPETQDIPVIIVSGADDRETCLRVIRGGATDYVIKPVNPELLDIRVKSAISKAENEHLRLRNNLLEIQNGEEACYRKLLSEKGLAVAELDCESGACLYGDGFKTLLAGNYDSRSLFTVLRDDSVADKKNLLLLRRTADGMTEITGEQERREKAELTTTSGEKADFTVSFYRVGGTNESPLKLIVAFSRD